MIKIKNVHKEYKLGKVRVKALAGITTTIKKGEFVAIMGPSGSGKSTLLHQIGAIDMPTKGSVEIGGVDLSNIDEKKRTNFRLHKLGMVFQFYSLLPELNAIENVYVPYIINNGTKKEAIERGKKLLDAIGLLERAKHMPEELSGGEQQRVAIARAMVNKPEVLLADEPTANLDTENGKKIVNLFRQFNKKSGVTVVMVTHERFLGKMADRIIWLKDGKLDRT